MLKTICRSRRSRLLILGAAVVLCATAVCAVPALAAQDVEAFILGEEGPTIEAWVDGDCEPAVTLAPEKCEPVEAYIENEAGDFPLPADGAASSAMEAFYAETGVQPYLIVTDDYELDADAYLSRRYERLFGGDEGHYLVLLQIYNTDNFDLWDYAGTDADAVLQGNAYAALSDALYGNMEALAENPDAALAKAFAWAAKQVLSPEDDTVYTYYDNGVYYDMDTGEEVYRDSFADDSSASDSDVAFAFIFPVIFSGIAIVAVVVRKAKKQEEAQNKTPPVIYVQMPKAPEMKKDAGPRRAQFPITCPGCGATAYPNDDGTCQYCGRAIFDPRG